MWNGNARLLLLMGGTAIAAAAFLSSRAPRAPQLGSVAMANASMSDYPAPPPPTGKTVIQRGQHPYRLQASVSRDELVAALRHGDVVVLRAALFALARLGDASSLAEVDAVANGVPGSVGLYARVVAAQIRATAAGRPASTAQVRQQMEALLDALAISPSQAERALRDQRAADTRTLPLIREAVLQLADMALMASNRGVIDAASASPVDLSIEPYSKVKAEYSRIPPPLRVQKTVEDLAGSRTLSGEDYLRVQLLIDEGATTEAVVMGQLSRMAADPAGYPRAGFRALLRTLRGVGTPRCRPVLDMLKGYPDGWVQYDIAQVESAITKGQPVFECVGY